MSEIENADLCKALIASAANQTLEPVLVLLNFRGFTFSKSAAGMGSLHEHELLA